MTVVQDHQGQEWVLHVNTDAIRRLKAEVGLSLQDLLGGEEFGEKLSEPDVMADVLWVLVRSQAEEKGMDRRSFEQRWTGKELQEAALGVMEAFLDFFYPDQKESVRLIMRSVAEQMRQSRIEALEKMSRSIGNESGSTTSATQPSSESTRALSLSGS